MRNAATDPIQAILNEARNGRMFILVDDVKPDTHGDLVIPAQMAMPERINFMAAHGRGLVCLALTRARIDALGLAMLGNEDDERPDAAFTTSIEAREGVTTGISAADRSRTISVAINSRDPQADIVTPGHVFPLATRDGGVLVRAGRGEAAVDIARLAGLNPSAAICKIMTESGAMAKLDDLVQLALAHDLKIGTIRDLIAYRREHDHLVEKRAEMTFRSRWGGDWRAVTFRNKANQKEHLALVKNQVDPARPTLVRMHTLSHFVDTFGEDNARSGLLSRSMEMIAEEGSGVVVIINRSTTDMISRLIQLRREGKTTGAPEVEKLRDYGIGAQILTELGVRDMILLTNTPHALVALDAYGLSVVGERAIPGTGDEW